jgi:hypothetical protein
MLRLEAAARAVKEAAATILIKEVTTAMKELAVFVVAFALAVQLAMMGLLWLFLPHQAIHAFG